MNNRRGFTLIELLVVVAIIALLMAILIAGAAKGERTGPICGMPRKPEGFHVCRSNVRR